MKILLISPLISHNKWGKKRIFPLGLGYVASSLLWAGHSVNILDLNDSSQRKNIARMIKLSDPEIIGIGGVIGSYKHIKQLTSFIKRYCPEKKIILGGAFVFSIGRLLLENTPADIIVEGEGEKTIVELVEVIEKKGDMSKINGILYKDDNGQIQTNPPRPPIPNLDSVSLPAWHLFNMNMYLKNPMHSYKGLDSMQLMWSRGCSFRCSYCCGIFGRCVRYRSAENVITEIQLLKERYNVRYLFFLDDTFTLNKKKAEKLCELIEKEDIAWGTSTRVDCVDEEILNKMKSAGCVHIIYGIESGSPVILQNMKKDFTREQSSIAIEMTRKTGIRSACNFMFGMIGETLETINETKMFCINNKIIFHPTYTAALPGTELYEISKARGLIKNEDKYLKLLQGAFTEYSIERPPITLTDFSTKELIRLKEKTELEIWQNITFSSKKISFWRRSYLTVSYKLFMAGEKGGLSGRMSTEILLFLQFVSNVIKILRKKNQLH